MAQHPDRIRTTGDRRSRRERMAIGLAFALVTGAAATVVDTTAAAAVTTPLVSTSYYMNTVNTTTLYNLGCSKGTADANRAGTQHTLVILDYGRIALGSNGVYNSSAFSGADVPLSSVVAAIKSFGQGYYYCTGSDVSSTAIVAYGTNNSAGAVTNAAGRALAAAVNQIATYFDSIGQVDTAGANDIEMGYGDYAPARAWADGYNYNNSKLYYDYGSATGCPQDHYGDECGTQAYPNWKAIDVWYVSWGNDAALPLPEIYSTGGGNSKSWKWIGVYSKAVQNQPMYFQGPMTQYGSCQQGNACSGTNNTPAQGYQQLYDQLNSDARTAQTPPYVTDIKYYNP
jgi:hypothetical protein